MRFAKTLLQARDNARGGELNVFGKELRCFSAFPSSTSLKTAGP